MQYKQLNQSGEEPVAKNFGGFYYKVKRIFFDYF